MRQSTFPRSGVLILAPDSVRSLLPWTLISQVESLLDSHRISDAATLADQQRKRLQGKVPANEDEEDELRYVYQRLGFQCFVETLFEDAGKHFLNGDLDPRIVVSYYPELRGSLFNANESVGVFAGVAEHMPRDPSVDDIISNYSPHLSPNTQSAPPTAELRKILGMAAKDMLEVFLRERRTRRRMSEPQKWKGKAVSKVEDTVLAKLFAQSEKTSELYALLREPNEVALTEIEPVLRETGQYNALCMIYSQRGHHAGLLDVWSKLVDGEWTDDEITDPMSKMVTLLNEKRDWVLTQEWGPWLTKRDPERGLKVLMSRDSHKRKDKMEDEVALLQQIRDANPAAGEQFLEYLVLQKRSTTADLHMQLAMSYIKQLLEFLAVDSVSKLWRAKASSYASSPTETSFLSYFATSTPDSDHKRVRLKTILFLQGSALYNPVVIREQLLDSQKILKLELVIVDGKLGNHHSALTGLVHDLRDATSAEAYCTLGGAVIPPKTAQSIGERCGLQQWTSALFPSPATSAKFKHQPLVKQKSVNETLKRDLLKILLEVYMTDDKSTVDRATRLLDSQSINLDVLDVIPLVPPDWSLKGLSSFLARSFGRTLHARHEGQIVKSISEGLNFQVVDRTWPVLRDYGAIVEEPLEEEKYDEKEALSAQVSLHLQGVNGTGYNQKELERKS